MISMISGDLMIYWPERKYGENVRQKTIYSDNAIIDFRQPQAQALLDALSPSRVMNHW